MALNQVILLALVAVATVGAYTSKCPDWNSCSIYTKKELSTMYFNSKYCMNIVPDKVVGNRFGSGQVRDLCIDRGLAIVQFSGAPKEDEPEEISNCLADYFGMSVVAPIYTCLQQALAKDISEMEQIPYSAAQKQTILGLVDKCMEQVQDQDARTACTGVAESQLATDNVWKANLPRKIKYCLYDPPYNVSQVVLTATEDCLNEALEKPLSN